MSVPAKPVNGRAPLAALFTLAVLSVTPTGCGQTDTTDTMGPGDPWAADRILDANQLSTVVTSPVNSKPLVLYVGPGVLYRRAHIPGALYIGPAAEPEGAANLPEEMQSVARDRDLVVYCGCCPWKVCPNVRQAVKALEVMGFRNVKVLHLPHSFRLDWINKGYPVEKGEQR